MRKRCGKDAAGGRYWPGLRKALNYSLKPPFGSRRGWFGGEGGQVVEGGAEIEFVAVLFDVTQVRRANGVRKAEQRVRGAKHRLVLEDVDRGKTRSPGGERGGQHA